MSRLMMLAVTCVTSLIVVELRAAEESRGQRMFEGRWTNVNKENPGVTRLEIKAGEKAATLQAWGKCSPEDCDWGATTLHLLGNTVSDRDLPYGFASWDHRFKVAHMTLRIEKGVLVAELFDIFTDDSGRSNFRSIHRFRRTPAAK